MTELSTKIYILYNKIIIRGRNVLVQYVRSETSWSLTSGSETSSCKTSGGETSRSKSLGAKRPGPKYCNMSLPVFISFQCIPQPLCFTFWYVFNVLAGRARYVLLLKGNVCYCNVYILNAHYVSTCCYCSIFVIFPFLCSRGNRWLFPLSFARFDFSWNSCKVIIKHHYLSLPLRNL